MGHRVSRSYETTPDPVFTIVLRAPDHRAREGEVCGCMYDNTGFKDCIDDGTVEYVVTRRPTVSSIAVSAHYMCVHV